LTMDQPKVGAWICDCEGRISQRVDTSRVESVAAELTDVVLVRRRATLCTRADMRGFESELREAGVNRVLFAGCSARSSLKFPEEQLTAAMARAGIDKGFLEIANLREQCAWLHEDRDAATRKAADLVCMAHARLAGAQTARPPVPLVPRALVIGGGAAGLQAAKSLAAAGQQVTLVERGTYLGGRVCQIGFLFQCEGWPAYCRSECVGPVQARDVVLDSKIEVLLQSEVVRIDKIDGNFQARIKRGAAMVDPDLCISCGECAGVCPEEVSSPFELGLYRRKAIDKDFERAVPDSFNIVDEACTRCGECVPVCPTSAINLDARPDISERRFGAVFLATGFDQLDLGARKDLGAGLPDVVTGIELERIMDHGLARPSDGEAPERVVFVLCAGSRATLERSGKGVPYCSKTCCAATVKQAERVLARNPMAEVVIIYNHDIRTYERALEAFYIRAKGMGVELVNAQVEAVDQKDDGRLELRLALGPGDEPDLDDVAIEDGAMLLGADMLVLAAAQTPHRGTARLLDQLGVLADAYGFPRENQVRLFRPTETMVDRVFAVGASAGPKVVQQAVEQGSAAAMKALPSLMRGEVLPGKFTSVVEAARCIRCRSCMSVCPHGAIRMAEEGAVSDPAFCQGCGFCAAACPSHAAQLTNFSDRQILDQARVAFTRLPAGEPKILALLCYWCSYSGGDLAGVKGMSAPASFRSIRIRCSSSVNSGLILEMLRMGIDGVLVAGCPDRSCHHAWGNYLSDRRVLLMRSMLTQLGLSESRLRFEYIGVPQSEKLVDTLVAMDRDLRRLGPNPIPRLSRDDVEAAT
jgi:heterodisulfide reductase subunit A